MNAPLQKELSSAGKPFGRARPRGALLQGLLPFDAARLPGDMLAGVTLAALAIPEVMGYTRIAGTPVVTGLYTLLLPAVLFAVFGSSRRLVVGADSATAAIMAATIGGLATAGSSEWIRLAGVLAIGCAVLLLIARLARLAFLADFLSRTVLAGFLTGVGLQVALGELPGMLGIEAHGNNSVTRLLDFGRNVPTFHLAELEIAGAVLVVVLGLRKVAPKWPGALVAVLAAIIASQMFDWGGHGVALVGSLQGGIPVLMWPDTSLATQNAGVLAPAVLAMSVVILAQSAATSRAYAWKYNEPFSEEEDIVGLSVANIGAAVTGAFVVNGSPTKTQMVDSAGGRSQIAHLTMAAVVACVLLFATGPISSLPSAALSTIVFLIGLDLLHVRELRRILKERPAEFWIALGTAACVLIAGVEHAIVFAMVVSLIDHVRRGYHPHNSVIVRGPDGHAQIGAVQDGGQYEPGLLVYRFSHAMYYANAEVLSREVSALAAGAKPPLRWMVIDLDAVDDVDYSAGATLLSLRENLSLQGTDLKFLRAAPAVSEQLRRYGVITDVGADAEEFSSVRAMRREFENLQTFRS